MVNSFVVDVVVEDLVANLGLLVSEDAGVHEHLVRNVIVTVGARLDLFDHFTCLLFTLCF